MRKTLLLPIFAVLISALSFFPSDSNASPLVQTNWTSTTSYAGGSFSAGSCVTTDGYIYCVGGTNNDQVWYAPVSSSGIGNWQQTTPYGEGGQNIFLSCAVNNGYIYCVGGSNLGGQTGDVTSDVWYAPISSSGVGSWTKASLLFGTPAVGVLNGVPKVAGDPIWAHSCVANNSYLYCIGGLQRTYEIIPTQNGAVTVPFDKPVNQVLVAPISSSGAVGAWFFTSNYGEAINGHSCVVNNGYIYCVAGSTGNGLSSSDTSDVWFTQIQSDGSLGAWQQTTSYGGGAVDGLSCSALNGNIYCVGGNTAQAWYAPLSSSGVGTWQAFPSYPSSIWEASCVTTDGHDYCVGGGSGGGNTATYYIQANAELKDVNSCVGIGGSWNPSTNTCTVNGLNLGGAALTIDSGITLDNTGTITNSGMPHSIGVAPTSGVININAGATLANSGTITNENDALIDDSGTLSNTGTITNPNGNTITIENSGMLTNDNSGAIDNDGAIDGNGAFTNSGNLTNSGNIGFNSLTNNNGGTIKDTNTIFVTNPVTNLGTIQLALNSNTCQNGSTIDPSSPFFIFGAWSSGTCTLDPSSPTTLAHGTVLEIDSGNTLVNEAIMTVNGSIDNAGTVTDQGVLNNGNYEANTGIMVVNGDITNSGTVNIQNVATFALAGSATLDNSGTVNDGAGTAFTNDGLITTTGKINDNGGMENAGSFTIENGGTLANGNGVTFNDDGALTNDNGGTIVNQGNIRLVGGFSNSGTIQNTGSITLVLDNNICQTYFHGMWGSNTCTVPTGTTTNLGQGFTLEIDVGVTFNNDGTLDSSGTISNSGTVLNSGDVTNDNVGTINNGNVVNSQIVGSFTNSATGSITNLGTINNIYVTFENDGTLQNNNGGNINNGGTLTNTNLLSDSGTITNNEAQVKFTGGTITNTGTIDINNGGTFLASSFADGGTVTNTGTVTVSAGGILSLNGGGGTLTNSGTITNNGSVTPNQSAGIFIDDGTLTNKNFINNTGSMSFGSSTFDSSGLVTNSGTITLDGATDNSGTITNTGTIDTDFGSFTNTASGIINNNNGATFGNGLIGTISNFGVINNNVGATFQNFAIIANNEAEAAKLINENIGVFTDAGVLINGVAGTETGIGNVTNFGIIYLPKSGVITNIAGNDPNGIAIENHAKIVELCGGGIINGTGTIAGNAPIQACPPTLTLSSPLNGALLDTTSFAVSGTASDGTAVSSVTWSIDGGAVSTVSGITPGPNINWSFTTSPLSDGLHTIEVNATDSAGLVTSSSISVTVETTPPTLVLPSDITQEATSPTGNVVTYTATATDIVDGTDSVTCNPVSGSTFQLGTTTVDCSSTDKAGNKATGSFTVTIQDTTPPTLSLPSDITQEATGNLTPVTYTATATDIVDGTDPVTCNPVSGSTFQLGTTTVNCSSTDAHGNKATGSFTVTIQDTTPPTITVTDIQAKATGLLTPVTYTATATDIVDGTDPVTCNPVSGSTFPLGTTTVNCSSTDAHGNKATASFTITVAETTGPSITVSDITQEATSSAGNVVTYTATATDVIDGTDSVTCNPASGSTFPLGTTTIDCSSINKAGITGTASFTVTIQDTTPPTLSLPSDITQEATGKLTPVTYTATATDIVDGTDPVTCNPVSGSTFQLGTTTVNCSSTDAHGNKATGSFTVTIQDTTPPILTLPSPITTTPTSTSGAVVKFTATAYDLVDGSVTPVCTPSSGSTFAFGTTVVSCTASDSHHNTSTGSFTVTVQGPTSGIAAGEGKLAKGTHFVLHVTSRDGKTFAGDVHFQDKAAHIHLDSTKIGLLSVYNYSHNAVIIGSAKPDNKGGAPDSFLIQLSDYDKKVNHDKTRNSDTFSITITDSNGNLVYQDTETVKGFVEILSFFDHDDRFGSVQQNDNDDGNHDNNDNNDNKDDHSDKS